MCEAIGQYGHGYKPPSCHEVLWMVVRSRTYYHEHILAYESGETCYSLVMGSGSFRTDF